MPDLPAVEQSWIADTSAYVAGLEAAIAAAHEFVDANHDALASLAELQAGIDALHGNEVHVGVSEDDLSGLEDVLRTLSETDQISHDADQAMREYADTVARVGEEWARAAGDVHAGDEAIGTASADVTQKLLDQTAGLEDAAAKTQSAARNATFFGSVLRALTADIPLFGGALSGVPLLASVAGWHLLADAVIETVAVWGPATIAVAAFGAVAAPTVQAIYTQMKNLETVSQATGQSIYPLSGGFSKLADSVKPQVYQLFGEALNVASQRGNTFSTMASGAGDALDQLAARIEVAVTAGHGMSDFANVAVDDLSKLGDSIGNVSGIVGDFIKVVPGYAHILLSIGDSATHVAEDFTTAAEPVLRAGLAFHGAAIYMGLAGTAVASALRGGITLAGNWAEKAAMAAADSDLLGGALSRAAPAMFGFAGAAADAAALPWGWITIAAAGVGMLVYAIVTAKDATQQWVGSLENTIEAAKAVQGLTDIESAQTEVASRLASAQTTLAHTSQTVSAMNLHTGETYQTLNPAYQQAQRSASELAQAQQILGDQANLYNYRLNLLAKTYGSTTAATGMLVAAGVPMKLMLTDNKEALAQIIAMVDATSNAYRAMGQTGGVLGADMSVLNGLASSQYAAMSNLNKAWATFLGLSTGLVTGMNGVITDMRQVDSEAKAAGASFTGTSKASLTLQNSFEQQVSALQGVIGGMRQAHASSSDLATVLSTTLKTAVDDGALANAGLRTQIYDMAREAGYAGPDAVGALTHWIDQNASSLHKAARLADQYAGSISKIPGEAATAANAVQKLNQWLNSLHSKTITVNVQTVGSQYLHGVASAGAAGGYAAGTDYAARGVALVGEHGPELVAFAGGERVYDHAATSRMIAGMASHDGGGGGGMAAAPQAAELTSNISIHLDGQEIWRGQQRETLQYNRRNGQAQSGAWAPTR